MTGPDTHPAFSRKEFARTVSRNTGGAMLLFIGLSGLVHSFLQQALGRELQVNPAFATTAVLYLGFILGWSIAYSRFFRFPENQRLLLAGAGIAAAIASMLGGLMRLAFGQTTLIEWLIALPEHLLGSLVGALVQIYGFAAAIRYILRIRIRS